MSEPVLDEVLDLELLALFVEGVLRRPCRLEHVPWVWWNDLGRPVCGICHPRVNETRTAA